MEFTKLWSSGQVVIGNPLYGIWNTTVDRCATTFVNGCIIIWVGVGDTQTQTVGRRSAFTTAGEIRKCRHWALLLWHLLSDTSRAWWHADASAEAPGCKHADGLTRKGLWSGSFGCIWVWPASSSCFFAAGASFLLSKVNRNESSGWVCN